MMRNDSYCSTANIRLQIKISSNLVIVFFFLNIDFYLLVRVLFCILKCPALLNCDKNNSELYKNSKVGVKIITNFKKRFTANDIQNKSAINGYTII